MKNMLHNTFYLASFLLLGACASAGVDAEIKNDKDYYQPIHKISSTKIFAADDKNANYADEQNETEENDILTANIKIETGAASKNPPIIIENKISGAGDIKNKMAAMVLFESSGYEIDKIYEDELKNAANTAKEKKAKVMVYGYASSKTKSGDFESQKIINFKMSLKRAQSVAEFLKKCGVDKDKIKVEAFGDALPLLDDKMVEGERLNRRVEVYIVY